MVMANLLYGTCKPHVMDIKIGQRTFQEDEVTNQKTRMDLLKKMMDVDPNEPTEEEKVPVTWRIVNIERCLGAKSLFQLKTCISRNSSEPCRTSLVHIQEKGITKLRYMQFREKQSSSRIYGFRIEAVSGKSHNIASGCKLRRSPACQ
jgi:1D-myo-inositol-triphosphate 3-kinase